MYVVFRADASITIGTGHVMRCLTLAEALRKRGAVCHFLCRSHPGHLIEYIRQQGFPVSELISDDVKSDQVAKREEALPSHSAWLGCAWQDDAKQTCQALEGTGPNFVVVDHYALDAQWEKQIRKIVPKIMVIDDLADRSHECDILLDQNWFGKAAQQRYEGLVPNVCKLLLGPKYALLKPEYALLRALMPARDGLVRRVLVFMGGSDPSNETSKVIDALNAHEFSNLLVDIVLGVNHPDPKGIANKVNRRPGVRLYQNLPSLAGLMARADLMISAGGSTSWERMCLGLPAVVLSIATNQIATNLAMQAVGYIFFLGESSQISARTIAGAIRQCIKEPGTLEQMSQRSQELVPGTGTEQVCDLLLG